MDKSALRDWIRASLDDDARGTMGFHSWVSVHRRYVCITVPKIACSRIKLTLLMLDGHPEPEHLGQVHAPGKGVRLGEFDEQAILEMLASSDWFRFCFVRNPYGRLLSAYQTQVGNTWNDETQWLKDEIKKAFDYPVSSGVPEQLVAFADFVRYLCDTRGSLLRDGHFEIQTEVLRPDVIPYDFIGRFETFQRDFESVLRRLEAPPDIIATASCVKNPTTPVGLHIAYDRELAGMAYELYHADFEHFSYDRNSWMYLA